jgi:galactokinase
MCKPPRRRWDLLDTIVVLIGPAAIVLFLSLGCTLRVEGFHRPEAELRIIVREECVNAILAYQQYLERQRETDRAGPMKPVS